MFVPLQTVRDPGSCRHDRAVARALRLRGRPRSSASSPTSRAASCSWSSTTSSRSSKRRPSLGAIVAGSPSLKAVVTSRTRLRVGGEQELPLEPLDARRRPASCSSSGRAPYAPTSTPDDGRAGRERRDLRPPRLPAARDRAGRGAGEDAVPERDPRSAGAPARAAHLGLAGRAARHRALRDTIGWSFELLGDDEQALFRRLSVFAGGCTLEAVEEVCGGDLDTLGSLVDESLVRSDGERFAMLETIREYALEVLEASARGRRRPARARRALPRLARAAARPGGATRHLARRLEADHGNLRAAIRFSLDDGDAATALELCVLLSRFWLERGYLGEGRLWLDEALAAPAERSPTRARALTANGVLSHYQADYDHAEELCRAALELSRSLGDPKGVAEALTGLALVRRTRGDYARREALFQEALAVYEELGDEAGNGADARPARHRAHAGGRGRSGAAALRAQPRAVPAARRRDGHCIRASRPRLRTPAGRRARGARADRREPRRSCAAWATAATSRRCSSTPPTSTPSWATPRRPRRSSRSR